MEPQLELSITARENMERYVEPSVNVDRTILLEPDNKWQHSIHSIMKITNSPLYQLNVHAKVSVENKHYCQRVADHRKKTPPLPSIKLATRVKSAPLDEECELAFKDLAFSLPGKRTNPPSFLRLRVLHLFAFGHDEQVLLTFVVVNCPRV